MMKKITSMVVVMMLSLVISVMAAERIAVMKLNIMGNYKLKSMAGRVYDMMREKLKEAGYEIIDEDKLVKALKSIDLELDMGIFPDEAKEINGDLNARFFILGDLQKKDSRYFTTTINMIDTKVEEQITVGTFEVTRNKEDIQKIIDGILNKIKESSTSGVKKYFDIAMDKISREKYKDAVKQLLKVIKLDPNNFKAYFFLGYIYSLDKNNKEDLQKSEEYLEKCIELKPDYNKAYLTLGYVYSIDKKPEKAEKVYTTYVNNNKTDPNAWFNLALSYKDQGNVEKAIEAFKKSIELKDDITTYLQILDLYKVSEDWDSYLDEGLLVINHASFDTLDIDKKVKIMTRVASLLQRNEKYEDAINIYKKLIAVSSEDPILYLAYGSCYESLEKYDNAIEQYNKAVELDSENGMIYVRLARCYMSKNKLGKAEEYAKKAIKYNPENAFAYSVYGNIYFKKGLPLFQEYTKLFNKGKEKAAIEKKIKAFPYFKIAWKNYAKALKYSDNDALTDNMRARLKDLKNQLMHFSKEERFFMSKEQKDKVKFNFKK